MQQQLTHRPGERRQVTLGDSGVRVGDGAFLVIAGPCSIEAHESMVSVAHAVADGGAGALRGGAWKPRTSPHSFQGLGAEGLPALAAARAATGLPVVTEVLDPRDVAQAATVADVLQVGARNMANGALLREAARTGLPVLLKRGFGATIAELLDAAEYVLAEGNEDVLLVERGIRTFETATRFTLDISAVPVLRERTHLPVLVDPSHPAGVARWVPDLARAAAAVGADGIMVEVHEQPELSVSDAAQAMEPAGFRELVRTLDPILTALGRVRSTPVRHPEAAPA